jgi:hypothetical protein
MRFPSGFVPAGVLGLALLACAEPTGLQINSGSPTSVLSEGLSPNRSQPVMLHGSGWGRVVFRQPEDGEARIFFITWLRELERNTTYLLQQAIDPVVDGVCTGGTTNPAEWLTIGVGTKPFTITTDERGSFHAPLYRTLPPSPGRHHLRHSPPDHRRGDRSSGAEERVLSIPGEPVTPGCF